jgi:glycogen phosphorylase
MSEVNKPVLKRPKRSDGKQDLLQQYGCGPIRFSGTDDALYERHLLFDDIVAPDAAGAREQYEATARSARDILSQRWVRTNRTYDREARSASIICLWNI